MPNISAQDPADLVEAFDGDMHVGPSANILPSQYSLMPHAVTQAMMNAPALYATTQIEDAPTPSPQSLQGRRRRRNKNPDREDKWEKHRETIIRMYVDEETCLEEVMSYMREKHGFRACEQAYKQTLRRWEVGKNIPASAMSFMVAKAEARRKEEGKETVFYWHDRPVQPKKLDRFKRRTSRGGGEKDQWPPAAGILQSNLVASTLS